MKTYFTFDGVKVPVRVKSDWKSSVRYSISGKSINLTIPKYFERAALSHEISKLHDWSLKQFQKDPKMLSRFRAIVYEDGEFLKIYDQIFQLRITHKKRKTAAGRINKNKEIMIEVPSGMDRQEENILIGKLLSRVFAAHFQKDITNRVLHFNDLHFHEEIKGVRLKNNQSNWGSCSSDKNINLSTRLLFAPQEVIDYVIVHELAHLKEMNHSPQYWDIVRGVMPDYEEKEQWLSEHGESCRF